MKLLLAAAVVLYCVLLGDVTSCPCGTVPFLHSQNQFCQNDFTIKAKIKKRLAAGGEVRYKIQIKQVFRSSPDFDALSVGQKKKLFTQLGDAQCEAKLNVRKTYVISGNVEDYKMQVTSCNWIELWKNLNTVEKANLVKNYPASCGCTIVQAHPVIRPQTIPSCPLWGSQFECGRLSWCECGDAACSFCGFSRSEEFTDCMRGIIVPIGKK